MKYLLILICLVMFFLLVNIATKDKKKHMEQSHSKLKEKEKLSIRAISDLNYFLKEFRLNHYTEVPNFDYLEKDDREIYRLISKAEKELSLAGVEYSQLFSSVYNSENGLLTKEIKGKLMKSLDNLINANIYYCETVPERVVEILENSNNPFMHRYVDSRKVLVNAHREFMEYENSMLLDVKELYKAIIKGNFNKKELEEIKIRQKLFLKKKRKAFLELNK